MCFIQCASYCLLKGINENSGLVSNNNELTFRLKMSLPYKLYHFACFIFHSEKRAIFISQHTDKYDLIRLYLLGKDHAR